MSSEVHSKLLVDLVEEINKLCEQFSRLSLCDDGRKSTIFNEFNDGVKQSISYFAHGLELLIADFQSELNENTLHEQITDSEKTIYSDSSCSNIIFDENVNMETCEIFLNLKLDDSESVSLASKTESVELTSINSVKSACENDFNSYACDIDKMLPDTIDKHDPSSGDKTLNTTDNMPCLDSNKNSLDSAVKYVKDIKINAVNHLVTICQNQTSLHKEMISTETITSKVDSHSMVLTKFYAVALPAEVDNSVSPNNLVCTEFKDALGIMKSYKGSRFKEFYNKEDALKFASQRVGKVLPKPKIEDDGSTLRSVTSQELCQLRKCIEKGDEVSFINTVWGNPKMLVGSCDTPSIMQEGMRYNALHVAAKSNKPYICQLVLDTIENPKFLQQIHPLKSEQEREKIMQRLIDLYINTPDKKTGDTPLHYASKFGCVDCVKVLLAHPLCVPDRRNVAGFTPREIICNRLQPKSISLVEDMEAAFKGLLYIPVLRSEENDVPPIVGKPCTCKEVIKSTQGSEVMVASPVMSLKAFVGPMAPEIAKQFYLVLKNPKSSQVFFYNPEELKLISKIRFSDRERGLERIGRWLAADLKVPWNEYFPFLNTFTNLAQDEGLGSLENYLKSTQHSSYESSEEESIFMVHHFPSHVNPLAHYVNIKLVRKNEKTSSDVDDVFSTPPSSPIKDSERDYFTTPPASPSQNSDTNTSSELFLDGSSLSKLDVDALNAIGDTMVDQLLYPNVSRWKDHVQNKLENTEKTKVPCANPLNLVTSVALPKLHLSEKICTPRRTLLNKAFCIEDT